MQAIGNFITEKFNAVVSFRYRDKIVGDSRPCTHLGIWNGIVGGIKSVVNKIIGAINGMIGGLNKVKFSVPSWVPLMGGKSFGFSIPKIPTLHTGTDYFMPPGGAREGLALLERGEQVISRDQAGKARELNININFSGLPAGTDETAIKQFLLRALREPGVGAPSTKHSMTTQEPPGPAGGSNVYL